MTRKFLLENAQVQVIGHPAIKYNGDEYAHANAEESCWNCKQPTHFFSLSFMAPLCSEECADAKWDEFYKSMGIFSRKDIV